MQNNNTLAMWLLLIGGLVHLVPVIYNWLAELTGGTPWVQIIVGLVSVVVALMALFGNKKSTTM